MTTTPDRQIRPLQPSADAEPVAPPRPEGRFSLGQKIGGAAAAALLAAGIGVGARALGGGDDAPRPETSTSAGEQPGATEETFDFREVPTYAPGAFEGMTEQEQYNAINESLILNAHDYLQEYLRLSQSGGDVSTIPVTFADSPENPAVVALQQLGDQMLAGGPEGSTIEENDSSVSVVSSEIEADIGLPEVVSQVVYDETGTITTNLAGGVRYTVEGTPEDNLAWYSVDYDGVDVEENEDGKLIFAEVAK